MKKVVNTRSSVVFLLSLIFVGCGAASIRSARSAFQIAQIDDELDPFRNVRDLPTGMTIASDPRDNTVRYLRYRGASETSLANRFLFAVQ